MISRIKNLLKLLVGLLLRIPGFDRTTKFLRLNSLPSYLKLKEYNAIHSDAICFFHAQPSHTDNTFTIRRALNKAGRKFVITNEFAQAATPSKDDGLFSVKPDVFRHVNFPVFVTPNVGHTRSMAPKRAKLVHTLVSLTSIDGVYEDSHFDDYDFIVISGSHQVESFEKLATTRPSVRGKYLLPLGYPKLDLAMEQSRLFGMPDSSQLWVTYAPTHIYSVNEKFGSLRGFGDCIIGLLINAGIGVYFRPHPVSFRDADKKLVAEIIDKYKDNPLFKLDRSSNYVEVYSKTHAMITDLSGTGFTYAFAFCRPVIFFSHNTEGERHLRGIQYQSRERIGRVVRSLSELEATVFDVISRSNDMAMQISQFRSETIYCLGSSGERISEALIDISKGVEDRSWIRL